MNRLRYFSAVFLTAAIIFFALQNIDAVEVRFLGWRFRASLSLIALGPFLVGLLLGGITALFYARRRHAPSRDAPSAAGPTEPPADAGGAAETEPPPEA